MVGTRGKSPRQPSSCRNVPYSPSATVELAVLEHNSELSKYARRFRNDSTLITGILSNIPDFEFVVARKFNRSNVKKLWKPTGRFERCSWFDKGDGCNSDQLWYRLESRRYILGQAAITGLDGIGDPDGDTD